MNVRRAILAGAVALLACLNLSTTLIAQGILRVPEDYRTIQEAIDAAAAGDTIVVQEGVYQENLVIREKEGIALLGAGMDLVTIDGNAQEQEEVVPGILIEDSSGITVKGFKITNSRRGLEAHDCTDLVIAENLFEGNLREGIELEGCEVEIRDNIVRNTEVDLNGSFGMGIDLSACKAVLIGNTIVGSADCGLLATRVDERQIEVTGSGNTIRDNKGGDLCGDISIDILAAPLPVGTLDRVAVPKDAPTIGAALELVKPGGTITVAAGMYQELVQVYKSVTIQGAGEDQTVITAPGPDWAVVNVAASGIEVVIEGLKVTGGRYGIEILTGPESIITLRDVLVEGNGRVDRPWFPRSVRIEGEATIVMESLEIVRNEAIGIICYGPITVDMSRCTVAENASDAIWLINGAAASVAGCTISGNGGIGVYVGTATADITDSTIDGNTKFGIWLYDGAEAAISGNTISGTRLDPDGRKGVGILVERGSYASIVGNTVSGNGSIGIELYDRSRAEITGNTVSGTRQNGEGHLGDGIEVEEGSTATIEKNKIEENARHGVALFDDSTAEIRGNTVRSNGQTGIIFWGTATGMAEENECSHNGLQGIEVREEATPTLEGNTCSENEGNGIGYWESGGGTAKNNTCSRNAYNGITVNDEARPTLEGNTCSENYYSGIVYWDAAGGFSRRNTCERNEIDGIAVYDSASPTLENNTCSNNEEAGISFYDRSRGTARGNVCQRNEWGIYVAETANPRLIANRCTGNRDLDVWDERR